MTETSSGQQQPRLDEAAAAAILTRALGVNGGADLVLSALGKLPGAAVIPARKTMFRSDPGKVVLNQWSYRVLPDGRLSAAHVVGGIVIADTPLPPDEAAAHIAGAMRALIDAHGPRVVPEVEAILAGLDAAAGV